jgi:hypothetical protein
MNKQELISRIEAERARLEEVIGTLSPDQMMASGAIGQWSVKDTLAHLGMWTARCVTLVYYAEQDQKSPDVDAMFDNDEALNAEDHESQKDRPLERVLADFRGTHRQLLRRLSGWKEAQLFDKSRYPWLRGMSVAEFLVGEVVDHDAEHQQQIKMWLAAGG